MESIDLNKIPVQETEGHTSKGNQLKWKLGDQWYKADHMGYEGLSEVLVSRLLHKAELKYPFVEYHPVEIVYKGQILLGCRSKNFLKENQKFPTPIITPTTKADAGHDENISKEEIIAQGLVSKEDYELMEKYTYALFARGTEMAAKKGLILVDTKYEFGKKDGKVYLIDEIHTPDSSRYFYADGYQEKFEKGEPQKQLSKEFVRQWLIDHNFMGKEGQQVPEMTDEYVNSVSDRYIELYEHIVGQKFNKADNHDDLAARIEKNVTEYLNQK